MATVVITFFLLTLTRFCVYKMDAEFLDRRRSSELSRRERRWSMNSQRLEEIVAELMKPISDVRRSFDTDLSALLEEYLTEAGLHALEACEADGEGEGAGAAGALAAAADGAPNFTELALLLQHSASVYGRKVDFLYQHVIAVSDSLQNSAQELEHAGEAGGEEAAGGRRRPRPACTGFAPIELTPSNGASKEAGVTRPPPTLPRVYVELEPRQLCAHHRPLTDYQAEPIGLLRDFQCARRLQDGMLVDELEGWDGGGARSLRPIPLMELQAAIAAAAPPALPPRPPTPPACPPTPPHSPLPLAASTPLDAALLPVKKERKRRSDVSVDCLVGGTYKILLNKKVRRRLQKLQEFSVDASWVEGTVRRRAANVLAHRAACLDHCTDFRGFENSQIDIGGFLGWSSSEATAAAALVANAANANANASTNANTTNTADDSDDDGFFEQSSNGDSDTSRADDHIHNTNVSDAAMWAAWQADVVSRAEAGAARPLDVREQAARVLDKLPRGPGPCGTGPCEPGAPAPAAALLAGARDNHDVAGLFLATLFLANAGNVEIIQGAPLTLNSFSVRFVSADERRYCSAAAADAELIHPPPPR